MPPWGKMGITHVSYAKYNDFENNEDRGAFFFLDNVDATISKPPNGNVDYDNNNGLLAASTDIGV